MVTLEHTIHFAGYVTYHYNFSDDYRGLSVMDLVAAADAGESIDDAMTDLTFVDVFDTESEIL